MATQPNPYRTYSNTKKTILPLSFENKTLEYSQAFNQIANQNKEEILSAPLCIEAVSQFFQFSLGLAAIKEYGEQSWALRCNASSGNLQPSEAYLISSSIQGIDDGLYHYSPQEHELELLSSLQNQDDKKDNKTRLFLSMLIFNCLERSLEIWRKVLEIYATWLWTCFKSTWNFSFIIRLENWSSKYKRQGASKSNRFDQVNRYIPEEREVPDMLIKISFANSKDNSKENTTNIDISKIRAKLEDT